MTIKRLQKQYELATISQISKTAIKVAKEICRLFPYIKQVQPHITGVDTGMGCWSFIGYGIGFSTEDECKGEIVKIEDVTISDIVNDGSPDWYDFPTNKELKELCELLNFLVDVNGLNCSTWQDGFNDNGIIFIHSETSNQNNPFSIPNKAYHMDSSYYRGLVKQKVPIVFEDKSKKEEK